MRWIALQWPSEGGQVPPRPALAWWALRWTPHVAWADEALLLEVSGCERLWGGGCALLRRLAASNPADVEPGGAQGATSLTALARLRLRVAGATPVARARDLPLWTLSAAGLHRPVLERLGCRTWGQVDALPRGGLARRFGPELGHALDVALGRAPDAYPWAVAPERFEESLDLPQRADSAPALLWTGRRLLAMLQQWLAARGQGALALEFSWTFDQLRLDGRELPPRQAITLCTAEAVRGMAHVERLLAERLARTALLAPAASLRLRVLQTVAWQPQSAGFLPEDQPRGDPLHVFIERVGARLGADGVQAAVTADDHRLGCRQRWRDAEQVLLRRQPVAGSRFGPGSPLGRGASAASDMNDGWADALSPTWLLRPPRSLAVQGGRPWYQGRFLHRVAGPRRIETGWWPEAVQGLAPPQEEAVARDYFIARDGAGALLLIFRERPVSSRRPGGEARWFLEGLYA